MMLIKALLVLSALFALPISATAQGPICARIFTSEVPWGALRPDFKHTTRYTVEVTQQSKIKNQCNLGTCHLHSWLSYLERSYEVSTGKTLTLSNEYVAAQHWLTKSLEALHFFDKKLDISLGAGPLFSRESLLEYGLIPEGVWKPRPDFMKNPHAQQISKYLENTILRAQWELQHAKDPHHKKTIRDHAHAQVHQIFEQMVGKIPDQFEWQGQTWTPQSFAKHYFSSFEGPMIQMTIAADRKAPFKLESTPRGDKLTANLDAVEATAKELLDGGHSVYLSYDHHHSYVDKETGIMSLRAFKTPTFARPTSRKMREEFDANGGGHAVQIVGYEIDPRTQRVVKWKIRNSWGTDKGDAGYFHMYDDYFRAFAKSITVPESLVSP